MKHWLTIISLLASLSLVTGCAHMPIKKGDKPLSSNLKFNKEGNFKIVVFGDIHWDKRADEDKQAMRVMNSILEAEKPDFVIYTGDNTVSDNLSDIREGYKEFTEPLVKMGIPWAATLGNHDSEFGGLARKDVYKSMLGLPGNLSVMGPDDIHGYGNYVLPVMSKNGKKIKALLYILDSNSYATTNGTQIYDWIHQDQIQWYRQTSAYYRQLNGGKNIPSYAFFHIPLQEFNTFYSKGTVIGSKNEDVCCSPVNSGLFSSFIENKDIKAVFCGHDHINDYIAGYEGLWLGYVRGISWKAYKKEGYDRGSRLIELKEGTPSFNTWLRIDGGRVINKAFCE
jgi:3',5'-cyclic AMP phosphodiesterase CpdA